MIEVYIDTFKCGFTAYYSSIEKMKELILSHPDFKKAFGFMISAHNPIETSYNKKTWKSWDYDNAIHDVFVTTPNDSELVFFVNGQHLLCTEYEEVPEVKEVGKPYSPETIKKIKEWKEEYRPCIHRATYRVLDVDLIKE
jgi:hypothetical protein